MIYSTKVLNNKDYSKIISEIKKSPNIFSYSKKELEKIENNPKDIIKYLYSDKKKLLGLFIIKQINTKYCELALLLIVEKYRSKGYGKILFQDCLKDLPSNKIIYTSSRNTKIESWLLKNDFKKIRMTKIPTSILLHLIKTKLKIYKLKDFVKKGTLSGWHHYLRNIF